MIIAEEILKKIEKNRDIIKSFGIKKIGLFGSYIRNEQKEGSDIDILVIFKERHKTFDNYMGLKLFLEELFGCKVDLVIRENVKLRLRPAIWGSAKYATGL